MTSNDYQILASRTLLDVPDRDYSHEEIMLVWNAIGLAGMNLGRRAGLEPAASWATTRRSTTELTPPR